MLTAEQRALRIGGLGSSEIGSVAGLNPFRTKYDVYCEKRQLVEQVELDSLPVRIGHICEGLICELYQDETGDAIEPATTLVHPEHPWVVATPDRLVVGKDRVLEAKWIGWRMAGAWSREEDGLPDYVRAQCEWLLLVTGRSFCDVAALLGGEEFRIYRIERNERIGSALLEIGRRFWFDHVVPGNPPSVDDSEGARDMLEALFAKTRPEMVTATAPIEGWIDRFMAASADKIDAERRKVEASNKICEFIGEAEGLTSSRGTAYWRRSKGDKRRSFRFFQKKETKVT